MNQRKPQSEKLAQRHEGGYMLRTDSLTLAGLRPSQRQVFEELVQKHEKYVYNIAYRMAGNAEEAKDLAQEAFVRAYKAFGRFEPGTSFERWLYRIVANLYIDLVRKRSRHREESLNAPVRTQNGELDRIVPDSTNDPDCILETTAFSGEIQRAVESITPEYRLAVILCDVQGFSYEEIAQILQVSIGTVRSRIHRGRRQLRERLRDYAATHHLLPNAMVEGGTAR